MSTATKRQVPGAGKSSFDLIDPAKFFAALILSQDALVADLGCGRGEYALEAAKRIAGSGAVYAVDLWEDGLVALRSTAQLLGLTHVNAVVADICGGLPFGDRRVDVCLFATVLHDLVREGCADGALLEARRILRNNGRLAVVEFKKFDGRPGPAIDVKLAPDQVEQIVAVHGFTPGKVTDIGAYNYLITFAQAT